MPRGWKMLKHIGIILGCGLVLAIAGACGKQEPTASSVCGESGILQGEAPQTHLPEEETQAMKSYDFSKFENIKITGIDMNSLNREELAVLYEHARYCQAMTEADIDTMRELVSEDMLFTHMSGKQQTRDEYFADVASGRLDYFTIGIENPVVEISGGRAQITHTSVLNAKAYGARGTYRISGTHFYEMRNGRWIAVNR